MKKTHFLGFFIIKNIKIFEIFKNNIYLTKIYDFVNKNESFFYFFNVFLNIFLNFEYFENIINIIF